jgi:hypothetical protein
VEDLRIILIIARTEPILRLDALEGRQNVHGLALGAPQKQPDGTGLNTAILRARSIAIAVVAELAGAESRVVLGGTQQHQRMQDKI